MPTPIYRVVVSAWWTERGKLVEFSHWMRRAAIADADGEGEVCRDVDGEGGGVASGGPVGSRNHRNSNRYVEIEGLGWKLKIGIRQDDCACLNVLLGEIDSFLTWSPLLHKQPDLSVPNPLSNCHKENMGALSHPAFPICCRNRRIHVIWCSSDKQGRWELGRISHLIKPNYACIVCVRFHRRLIFCSFN